MQRRQLHRLALAALAATGTLGFQAHAQAPAWPNKPIRLVVPAPAGSAPDIIARLIGEKIGRALGQAVVVDNRPGAGGIIAMNHVKAAPADGYTFAFAQAAVVTVTPFTYKEATYDMERDFETVSMVGRTPMMIVANLNNPARSLADVVAQAKAKPDQVSIGNPTRTSIPHLAAEMAGMKAGVKFQQVPFSSTPAGVQAVVGGDIQFYIDGAGPLIPLVKGGKVRPIAVAADTVMPGLEDYPLVNKTIPGLNVFGWFGIFAPKGTPAAIIQRINAEASQAQQQPDMVARFSDFGTYPTPGSVADAARYVKAENEQFGSVIKSLGLKAE